MIAALYIDSKGPYAGRPDVDPWDEKRDARLYAGPWPVVCHSPCARWGRYHGGGPSARVRRVLGDDGGCFAAALAAVRRWGGVLEHPEGSHAWRHFQLFLPPKSGGWVAADLYGGWTCCVEQGHYGHRARKATWLYVDGVAGSDLPALRWGPAPRGSLLDLGFHSAEELRQRRGKKLEHHGQRLTAGEALLTPLPFAELLLDLAGRVRRHQETA